MHLKDAFILGLVQGVAEWLPVSSAGHLAVLHHIFGLEGGISFDIFLHLSSLLVILIFFRKDISEIIKALLKWDRESPYFMWAVYIIIATFVTVVAGVLAKPYLQLITVKVLPYTFLFTSLLLFLSSREGRSDVDMKRALFIGFLQGIALLPGVSRSGATISGAKISGVNNEDAFRFSFLLAVPAILGAVLYEANDFGAIPVSFLLTGFLTSFFVGLGSLYLLKKIVIKKRFYLFGFYTLFLSIILYIRYIL